jgi:hypothetical protein
VDQRLKEQMKELGEAINKSLSDSGHISEVVSRIKEDGYDPFMVLEATIGVSKKGEKISDKASAVSTFSMGTSESARSVRVLARKPDGTPHPSAGKTGRVRKLLPIGAQMRAVVEVENDFILVSVESLEVLQHPPAHYQIRDTVENDSWRKIPITLVDALPEFEGCYRTMASTRTGAARSLPLAGATIMSEPVAGIPARWEAPSTT